MIYPKTRTSRKGRHIKLKRFSCTNLENIDSNATVALRMVEKVTEPTENDILLGRGGKNNQWIGNEKLRDMARQHCQEYLKASKKSKSQISRNIVDKVRNLNPPGRFLRKCSAKSEEWEDVGDHIAREKTSQVLRDAIQARKSFSGDGDRYICKVHSQEAAENRQKSPPQKVTKTPAQQPFQPSRQVSVPKWRSNPSLPLSSFRISNQSYSPVYSSMILPSQAYARATTSELGNQLEEAPKFSSASHPYHQYPVTPTSSKMTQPTAKKRARYFQESPLIQGYHKYPYPTPIRKEDPPRSSPLTPTVFKTSANAEVHGFPFTPPNSRRFRNNPRRISTLHTGEKNHPAQEIVRLPTPPPAPVHKSRVAVDNRIVEGQDLAALMNDDVLSDSSNQDDSIF